ncbi:MAG: DinB family protein [Phycisphaeraceae bacterium]
MTARVQLVRDQWDVTRRYTLMVLDHMPRARWAEMPPCVASHVTWQVGHLTLTQAGNALAGVCGVAVDGLLPEGYRELFGKGSRPLAEAERYPEPEAMLTSLARVHARLMDALGTLDDAVLDEPASHSTGMVHNKLDMLLWMVRHEMLHVGQIGLIRRALGMDPYR